MNASINTSCINETNTWIFVLPADNRQDNDDFNSDDIQLTWNITSFTQNKMYIQLNFSNPEYISPLSE